MEEFVKLVSERSGLSEETARTAVEAVLSVLKERLPSPLADQIAGLVAGTGSPSGPGDLLGGLGGLLGRR